MLQPPNLQPGDTIAIVAMAKKIDPDQIQLAVSIFESWGLKVIIGKTIGGAWNQFSGTDQERAEELQNAINNPTVKAVISARGGYGSVRIIDQIDFEPLFENPKWLIGFSDITAFHSHLNSKFDFPTLHATMPVFFEGNSKESLDTLKQVLFEGNTKYQLKSHQPELCKDGVAKAQIVGGNLSIIYSLCGSPSALDAAGKILFLEDLCEYLYATDRMLQNLKRNRIFDNCAGIIIGGFSDMKDGPVPFGQTVQEMIFELVKHRDIPVFPDFPAGHISDNRALVFGSPVHMEVKNGQIKLTPAE